MSQYFDLRNEVQYAAFFVNDFFKNIKMFQAKFIMIMMSAKIIF